MTLSRDADSVHTNTSCCATPSRSCWLPRTQHCVRVGLAPLLLLSSHPLSKPLSFSITLEQSLPLSSQLKTVHFSCRLQRRLSPRHDARSSPFVGNIDHSILRERMYLCSVFFVVKSIWWFVFYHQSRSYFSAKRMKGRLMDTFAINLVYGGFYFPCRWDKKCWQLLL